MVRARGNRGENGPGRTDGHRTASLGTRNEGTGVLPSGNASYLRSSRMTALTPPAMLRDAAAKKTQRPTPTELCMRGTRAQEGVMSDDNLSVPKQNPAENKVGGTVTMPYVSPCRQKLMRIDR